MKEIKKFREEKESIISLLIKIWKLLNKLL